jgi:hypothetical protein
VTTTVNSFQTLAMLSKRKKGHGTSKRGRRGRCKDNEKKMIKSSNWFTWRNAPEGQAYINNLKRSAGE